MFLEYFKLFRIIRVCNVKTCHYVWRNNVLFLDERTHDTKNVVINVI